MDPRATPSGEPPRWTPPTACFTMIKDTGTEGQVGHHDDADDRSGSDSNERCCDGERTGGHVRDWPSIDWRAAEDEVRRLRQRIFTASRAGDLAKVRNLQKLTAPRGALLYPRLSREEFEGRFLGLMP